jgi:hypothetical protein
LAIALAGHDAGLWHDHATGEGGDLISLFMAYRDYRDASPFNLALHEIARDFFRDQVAPLPQWQQQHNYRSAQHVIEERKAKLGSKPRADMVELGAPVATWKYLDTEGNVIASVSRYEPGGTPESKTFRPFTFKTIDGVRRLVAAQRQERDHLARQRSAGYGLRAKGRRAADARPRLQGAYGGYPLGQAAEMGCGQLQSPKAPTRMSWSTARAICRP